MSFFIADEDAIKRGLTTDVYFLRTKEVLEKKGVSKNVVAEFTASSLPHGYKWAIFSGLESVLELLEGIPIDVYALKEGTLFRNKDLRGVPVPVVVIQGKYENFVVYETPILGFICQGSGIATKAARVRIAAGDLPVLSFGVRRMHPAISPFIDRNAYIGGCDGVSSILGGEAIGKPAVGTMPHALIIVMGEEEAWESFDEVVSKDIPRIALIDTYGDEKLESIKAAQIIRDLKAVRLDTPGSRRGNFASIVKEVRWELDLRGFKDVEIFVSGGLDENSIPPLKEAGASGFGVGTSIANAPTIDFAMDIVEVEGKPAAKKGKFGGRKRVLRCEGCLNYLVIPYGEDTSATCPLCGGELKEVMEPVLRKGKRVGEKKSASEIRDYVLKQLAILKNNLQENI